MSPSPPAQVVIGPAGHGVVEYALDAASAVARGDAGAVVIRVPDVAGLADALDSATARAAAVHLHVTDALFGATLEDAAETVAAATRRHRVSLTLHDLPQPSDGERNLPRRARAYRRMAEGAVGVAVSSHHEAALFAEFVDADRATGVVPLGTRHAVAPSPAAPDGVASGGSGPTRILMAGYIYPGKGHDDVIDAAGRLTRSTGRAVEVVVLGGVVPGHEVEADRLTERAAHAGVAVTVTGFLTEADYRRGIASAGIPVVAHRHYSASRSLLDWAEAGRRALVVPTRYTTEMAALRPGTLRLAGTQGDSDVVSGLVEALTEAAQDPASTRLAPGQPLDPTLDDVARLSREWWRSLSW